MEVCDRTIEWLDISKHGPELSTICRPLVTVQRLNTEKKTIEQKPSMESLILPDCASQSKRFYER